MENPSHKLRKETGNTGKEHPSYFSVIWGQCSPTMQSKLQSLDEYDARSEAHDCAWILQEIKGVTHKFEGTRYICMSLHDAIQHFYNCKQEPKQSLHDYLGHYRTVVEVLDHYIKIEGKHPPWSENCCDAWFWNIPFVLELANFPLY